MDEKPNKRRIGVYLRSEVIDAVLDIARTENRSLSNMIDRLLADSVNSRVSEGKNVNVQLSGIN